MSVIILVETIHTLFKRHKAEKHTSYRGICHSCDCDVEVEITKTSRGFGFEGDVLYGSDPESIFGPVRPLSFESK